MATLKQMNRAMQYTENNLTTEIDYKEISKIAGCSKISFQVSVFLSCRHVA